MRLAVISFSDLGSDPRVLRQVDSFLANGWEVDALVMGPQERREGLRVWSTRIERKRRGVIRYVLEYLGFWLRTLSWVTARVLRSEVDLVYVNSPPDILTVACVTARARGVPVILDIHDPMPELWGAKGRGRGLLSAALLAQERLGARMADTLITVHEPMRELIASRNPGRDIKVVLNVPDVEMVESRESPGESRVVVFTGTVAFRYGLDDLVRAMSSVAGSIPGLTLRVIGDGEDRDRLTELAHGLDVKLDLVGRVPWSEVQSLQDDAWVGANLPKPDALGELSFSNKIVEWVAAGIPVVASRTATLLRYFPEDTLHYVESGSTGSIASTLIRIHTSSEAELADRAHRAQEALNEIAWPVQRAELLRTVSETAQFG